MESTKIHSEGVTPTATQVEVVTVDGPPPIVPPVLRLRLKDPKSDRRVGWEPGTVDNEHLQRKKSKCCCIYKKPVAFGESSSEDDEECDNCFGHPEKKRKNKKSPNDSPSNSNNDSPSPTNNPTPEEQPNSVQP